jgi:hypothetical protein
MTTRSSAATAAQAACAPPWRRRREADRLLDAHVRRRLRMVQLEIELHCQQPLRRLLRKRSLRSLRAATLKRRCFDWPLGRRRHDRPGRWHRLGRWWDGRRVVAFARRAKAHLCPLFCCAYQTLWEKPEGNRREDHTEPKAVRLQRNGAPGSVGRFALAHSMPLGRARKLAANRSASTHALLCACVRACVRVRVHVRAGVHACVWM